jgi:predicted regulator of Ras-like GTPase activity (Roadblock/LC7/MglB family)
MAEAIVSDEQARGAHEGIEILLQIDGAIAAAIVDSDSGMVVASGGSGVDVELAAAGYTEVMRAQLRNIRNLGLVGGVEDSLLSLETQYHIVRPVAAYPDVFMLLILDRAKSNLAMARLKLRQLDTTDGGVGI